MIYRGNDGLDYLKENANWFGGGGNFKESLDNIENVYDSVTDDD